VNKYRWQAGALVLVAFMLGCNEFMVVGVISDIARSLRVTVATAGYLVTIFAIVYAVSTPVITLLANRFNRYRTLMVLTHACPCYMLIILAYEKLAFRKTANLAVESCIIILLSLLGCLRVHSKYSLACHWLFYWPGMKDKIH